MIKKVISTLILILIFSCNSAKVKKGEISYRDLNNIDYTEIQYSFESDKQLNSRAGINFIKNNNHTLDSIFLKDSEKFKIRNKIHSEKILNSELISDLIYASENNFNSTNLEKIMIEFQSLQKNKMEFLMIPYIKPSLTLVKSYSNRNTSLITEPHYTVSSFELKIFIIDVEKNNISLYGSKKVKRKKSLSYGENMFHSLNKIIEEFKN
jgi:hypothetical protein